MGHEVIGMEEYVAEGLRPLDRCLADVSRCDLYVGIFGWRYGSVVPPSGVTAPGALPVSSAVSVTESEFRAAIPKKPLAFLVDPRASWPAHSVDAITGENEAGARIKRLRDELTARWLVGFFSTAEDLARQVSAAVHRREVNDRMGIIKVAINSGFMESLMGGGPISDSTLMSMKESLGSAALAEQLARLFVDDLSGFRMRGQE
jgi:hypothetical protein